MSLTKRSIVEAVGTFRLVLGAIAASGLLYGLRYGRVGFDAATQMGANGFAQRSPAEFGLGAALLVEFLLTFMFPVIILGSTDSRAPPGDRAW